MNKYSRQLLSHTNGLDHVLLLHLLFIPSYLPFLYVKLSWKDHIMLIFKTWEVFFSTICDCI